MAGAGDGAGCRAAEALGLARWSALGRSPPHRAEVLGREGIPGRRSLGQNDPCLCETSPVTTSTAQGQSQAAGTPIQTLRQRLHQLMDTVHTMQRRCDELSHQGAAARSQQQALSEQLNALMLERDRLNTERDALAASQQELSSQRNGLHQQRDALQTERDDLQAERDALSAQRDGLQEERDRLRAERDALAASQQELSSQCDALQAERHALQEQRDALQSERDDLSSRLLTLTSEYQELASKRQELSGQLDTLSAQCDGLEQERDRLNSERGALQAERDSLQEEKNRLETDKQQLRAALEHVFPYETYKEKRPDLNQHDHGQLIDHFVRHRINENTDLRHAPMWQRLEDCQKENRKLHKDSALIRQELSKAQIHMELLKELIVASKPRRQAKDGKSSLV